MYSDAGFALGDLVYVTTYDTENDWNMDVRMALGNACFRPYHWKKSFLFC